MSARGTSNTNSRGNSAQRRVRRLWLIENWMGGFEHPHIVRCCFCGTFLTETTITVDRIIPGVLGGTYRVGNIRPACGHCNSTEGSRLRDLLRGGANFFSRTFPDTGISHPRVRHTITGGQSATIRFLLADARMSQARIAREAGVSPKTVQKIQRLGMLHPTSHVEGSDHGDA